MKSSLTFQMILHLGAYLIGGFVILEFAIMLYKAIVLPYPGSNLSIEFLVLLAFSLAEFFRIFFAWKGNLTENPGI